MTKAFQERIRLAVKNHHDLVARFFDDHVSDVVGISVSLAEALKQGGKILFFGNGGSAADAQHLAAELVNRMEKDRQALAAVSLTTDTSVLTSIANDSSYRLVFARQIRALGRPGDVAFGISTSGRSPNLLEAFREARELGLLTVALLGRDGGPARELVESFLVVPGEETARIQEVHLMVGHLLCEMIELALFPPDSGP